jgi:hypothetical protein
MLLSDRKNPLHMKWAADWKAIIAVFCCFFGNLGMFMVEAVGLMPKISILQIMNSNSDFQLENLI